MQPLKKIKSKVAKVRNVTTHYYQRCKYGVSFEDEISLDDYIAKILIHSLPKYKSDGKYGMYIRHLLPKDATYEYKSYVFVVDKTPSVCAQHDLWEKAAVKRWDTYLDEIIEPLKDRYLLYKTDKEANKKTNLAWRKFARQSQSFWW